MGGIILTFFYFSAFGLSGRFLFAEIAQGFQAHHNFDYSPRAIALGRTYKVAALSLLCAASLIASFISVFDMFNTL